MWVRVKRWDWVNERENYDHEGFANPSAKKKLRNCPSFALGILCPSQASLSCIRSDCFERDSHLWLRCIVLKILHFQVILNFWSFQKKFMGSPLRQNASIFTVLSFAPALPRKPRRSRCATFLRPLDQYLHSGWVSGTFESPLPTIGVI